MSSEIQIPEAKKKTVQDNSLIPTPSRRVLIVDDNETTCKQLQTLLHANPALQVTFQTNGQKALEELARDHHSILITDLRMPGLDGMELIREIQERRLPVTVIVTTGHGSIDEAVQAIRLGAYDFLTKPVDVEYLRLVIDRALRERALQDEVTQLRSQLQTRYSFHNILSKNPRMHGIFEMINNVADTNTTILIEGETGTGKEQVARAVQGASHHSEESLSPSIVPRYRKRCWRASCSAMKKGPLPAQSVNAGAGLKWLMAAPIFLDEIGDVPPAMQGETAACLARTVFRKARRVGADSGGCTGHRRHQSFPAKIGQGRQISRGSVLPPECGQNRFAAPARTSGGYSSVGDPFHREVWAAG